MLQTVSCEALAMKRARLRAKTAAKERQTTERLVKQDST